jgi:hypothetical protein
MRWILLLLLVSCGSPNLEDLRAQAEREVKQLTQVLKAIDTKEDLVRDLPKVRKRFTRIAELAVTVRELPEKSVGEPMEVGDQLFMELARLYELPGCRELIESAQADAVARLMR